MPTTSHVRQKTYRRFFQFRLSTWLVLVGIVAWAMAIGPYLISFDPFVEPGDEEEVRRWNPALLWPALALVTFIGWKAFWLIRERRKPNKQSTGD